MWAVPLSAYLKDTSDDALLAPGLACLELSIGHQARYLGTGSGSTWGTIVRATWAQHEVLAICAILSWPIELNMVDFTAVFTRKTLSGQLGANVFSKSFQIGYVILCNPKIMVVD